jgi:hypothetical protein
VISEQRNRLLCIITRVSNDGLIRRSGMWNHFLFTSARLRAPV